MIDSAPHSHASKRRRLNRQIMVVPAALALVMIVSITSYVMKSRAAKVSTTSAPIATPTALPSPRFDPDAGAALPQNRVVAFYAVPGAAATGPAHELTDAMLALLKQQAAVYQRLDPAHPVLAGIDLVVSVPDRRPGPAGTYSHHVDAATIDRYVEFCRKHGLLLFLDLNFGWSDPLAELNFFRPYLTLPFVHVAVDPEWMFPRHNGVPGINLSNVRAADLNPLISAVAQMSAEYQVPRKIFMIHQYRPDGDDLTDPYNPGAAILADKRNLLNDTRVDVVVHVDSVGGWPGDIEVKTEQYTKWVAQGMQRFQNFRYGGFKIFYQLESKHKLMTPEQVMALQPAPMVITYGN